MSQVSSLPTSHSVTGPIRLRRLNSGPYTGAFKRLMTVRISYGSLMTPN